MAFADTTPLLPGETIMSWVARIAREQAGMASFDYLNFIEFGRKDLLEATPAGLARLARISGAPIEDIADGAYLRIADRLYEHRRQRFHAEFAGRERTTFCPACLLEDARPESPSRGLRVGRVNWLFSPFRTCPTHGIPLYRTIHQSYAERFQDMTLVAPDDGALVRLAEGADTRPVSPLQRYVEDRLDGKGGAKAIRTYAPRASAGRFRQSMRAAGTMCRRIISAASASMDPSLWTGAPRASVPRPGPGSGHHRDCRNGL